ncbi:ORF44 [Ictalurid herpesvirus 1]|nr:ORF44 [Ictalurid herpesvirus 1]
MGTADEIHPDVLAECIHFAHKKINGLITQNEKKRAVFKCLLKSEFSETDLSIELPDYVSSVSFRKVYGLDADAPISWRHFRLITLLSFARFLAREPEASQYITQRASTAVDCSGFLETGATPQWKLYLPRVTKIGRQGVLRKFFQICKKTPSLTPEYNLKLQVVVDIMRRYTVEDPLDLLVTIYPEFTETLEELAKVKRGAANLEHMGLIYHVLNAHINWFAFNRHQFLNPGITLPSSELSQEALGMAYDLRCSGCWRLLSIRSLRKTGNPKNMKIYYSTDSHGLISSCCKASVLKAPLSIGKTALVINTPFKQQYHICACGCEAIVYNDLPVSE